MDIKEIEKYFSAKLPETYKKFLLSHSVEITGNTYLYLPEDLIERNECYETKTYAPGYIAIGDNGGGQAFIIELNTSDPEVSIVDHGSMDPNDKQLAHTSFEKWLKSEFKRKAK